MNSYPQYSKTLYSSPPLWVDRLSPELLAAAEHVVTLALRAGITSGSDALTFARCWARFGIVFTPEERSRADQFRSLLDADPAGARDWFTSQLTVFLAGEKNRNASAIHGRSRYRAATGRRCGRRRAN